MHTRPRSSYILLCFLNLVILERVVLGNGKAVYLLTPSKGPVQTKPWDPGTLGI